MPEEKGKTPDEKEKEEKDQEGKDEEEKEEEDEFSDLFDSEEESEEEDEEESPEEKTKEKPKKKEKKSPDVEKIVEQRISNAEKKLERRADVTEFFAGDKGKMFAKYRDQIAKAAQDPRFLNIPVSKLPQLILTDKAYNKVLDDARKEADLEAEDSATGGSTAKDIIYPEELKQIDPSKMSKEEFAVLKARALRGEFRLKKKE